MWNDSENVITFLFYLIFFLNEVLTSHFTHILSFSFVCFCFVFFFYNLHLQICKTTQLSTWFVASVLFEDEIYKDLNIDLHVNIRGLNESMNCSVHLTWVFFLLLLKFSFDQFYIFRSFSLKVVELHSNCCMNATIEQ